MKCNDLNVTNTGCVLNDSAVLSYMFSQQCCAMGKAGSIYFQMELKKLKAIGPKNAKARAHLTFSEMSPLWSHPIILSPSFPPCIIFYLCIPFYFKLVIFCVNETNTAQFTLCHILCIIYVESTGSQSHLR